LILVLEFSKNRKNKLTHNDMNINNKITLFLILFFGFNFANAQETVYSQVLVKVENTNEIQRLVDLDFDIDHYKGVGQNSISFYVTSEEIQKLRTYGFSFDVTIPNFTEYYMQQRVLDEANMKNLKKAENTANGFDLGSMGGFYTFEEVETKLDEMKTDYPNLITSKTLNVVGASPSAFFEGLTSDTLYKVRWICKCVD
jgi:hypothetical protein